ncbi:hypothetical protein [Streptomyces sp. NPDC001275]
MAGGWWLVAGGWWLDQNPPGPSVVAGDVFTESSGTLSSDGALVAWRDPGPPTYSRCAALLNGERGRHSLDVRVGDRACVGTWQHRVGCVEVTAIPDGRRVEVAATVWEQQ